VIGIIRNWRGPHKWLVVIFVPMFLHAPMQLGKVFTFCKVFKKENKCSTKRPTKKMFHKKTSKKSYSTKNLGNK
jgi:hypothetical protein